MPTNEEGYRVRSLRSSFTKQPLSNMKSSPGFGFGTSTRDQFGKTYASSAADKSVMRGRGGNQSQGPAYSPNLSAFGRQSLSRNGTAGTSVFGLDARLKPTKSEVPGPGAYATPTSLGGAPLSKIKNAPKPSFGTSNRAQASHVFISSRHEKSQFAAKDSPGPGNYNPPASTFGKQPASRASTAPSTSFAQGLRLPGYKSDVPGPGSYYAW